MRNEDTKLEDYFLKNKNNWDTKVLNPNHQNEFRKKLGITEKNYFIPFIMAASLLLLVGLTLYFQVENQTAKVNKELHFASKETQQTDSIFTVIIKNELIKIKEKKSPENEKIVSDALIQMKNLDLDYQNIIKELETNGESKLIINALITNLQTRITFLQSVLKRLESNKISTNISDEKTV